VGIDENGLGPRLGPLIVTAVTARCEGNGEKIANGPPGRSFARLGDSKDLVAHGDTSLGEAWARAIAAWSGRGKEATTPDALVAAMCIDSPTTLRSRCPSAHEGQCWSPDTESFACDPKLFANVSKDLKRLSAKGVSIVRVDVAVVCTERLNDAVVRGLSRFVVDLHTMERLALAVRDASDEDLSATCGKVGGYDRYSDHFGPLSGRLHAIVTEGRARSEYQFPGLGRMAFVRDADASNLLVGMASLVGKWVRDLLMDRVVRYHRLDNEGLPSASGYHDPVTTRFIEASALSRKTRELPDDCFERRALPPRSA
jgi:ribonuclease HII